MGSGRQGGGVVGAAAVVVVVVFVVAIVSEFGVGHHPTASFKHSLLMDDKWQAIFFEVFYGLGGGRGQ